MDAGGDCHVLGMFQSETENTLFFSYFKTFVSKSKKQIVNRIIAIFPVGLILVSRTILAMQSRSVISAITWKLMCHGEVLIETAAFTVLGVKQQLFLGVKRN